MERSFFLLTIPKLGSSIPAKIFNNVDFPVPFLPTNAIRERSWTSREIFSNSTSGPKCLASPCPCNKIMS